MNREEIERRFVDVGWELDGSFSEHLVIGCSEDTVSLGLTHLGEPIRVKRSGSVKGVKEDGQDRQTIFA